MGEPRVLYVGQSCGNDKQSPSKWVVVSWEGAVRVEIYFVTITADQTLSKERYLRRETFRLPLLLCCRILRMFGGKVTDIGYARNWI